MAAVATNGASDGDAAADYELLPKLIPNLDRHMIYPLLEFASSQEGADVRGIKQAQYDLFKKTNMVEFVVGIWQEVNDSDSVPGELAQKQHEVESRQTELEEASHKVQELLDDEDVVGNLRADKVANLKYLQDEHGVTVEDIDALYAYGRFQYDCGRYADAAGLLERFRILSTDNEKANGATWGKLAAEILSGNWEAVMEEVNKVKESIDTKLFNNPLAQLQHRTWLIHWCLFAFFNYDQAKDTFCDMYFSPAFINTIQTSCPWVLRYLAVSVITGRTRSKNSSGYQKQIKDLTRVVRQEGYEYRDPVTDFVRALNVDFDFEEAQRKLTEAEGLLQRDFFTQEYAEAFVESARHLISEAYCRIHQRIDIKDLSARLGLNQDEGEKWIVNLIRDTRVDAKIDYKDGTVVMNHPPQSVYQQVIERTKGGFFRTQVLSAAVAK